MNRVIDIELVRVCEATALAAYNYVGHGNKNVADGAAVEVMRYMLDTMNVNSEIVIGEGEIDEAPMLYIGEKLGSGEEYIDIAVDPIEGTRMVAMGQSNALVTILAAEKDSLLKAPDMYMEKLIVPSGVTEDISLELDIIENIKLIAKSLNKEVNELRMVTLAKPRHDEIIKKCQDIGVKVHALPDGDIAASIMVHDVNSDIDFMYTIGGAPEGVVSAGITKALDGNMKSKLLLRHNVKGNTDQNKAFSTIEANKCKEMNVEVDREYSLDEVVKTDNVIFCATGITKGDILDGVRKNKNIGETESVVIRGKSGTIRKIKSTHILSKKDKNIAHLL